MFFQRKEPKQDQELDVLLAPDSVVLVSARCCHPGAGPQDEALLDNVRNVLRERGIGCEPRVVTVTDLQSRYLPRMAQLSAEHRSLGEQILGLFSQRGLAVFPMLFVSGKLVVWGGVAPMSLLNRRLDESGALAARA
jgi:hypothetical protein